MTFRKLMCESDRKWTLNTIERDICRWRKEDMQFEANRFRRVKKW